MEGNSEIVAQANRTRSRLGCLCCRRRRRKCDRAQPRCRNCQARGDECRWGLKVSFHPSRTLRLSSEDSATLFAIEGERCQSDGQSATTIVDNTDQIVRGYRDFDDATSQDTERSRAAPPRAESHLNASTSNEHQETLIAEYAESELNPSSLILLNHNIVANPGATAQSQGSIDSHFISQSTWPSECWNPQEQGHSSSTSTLASAPSSLHDQAVSCSTLSQTVAELPILEAEQTRLIRVYLQETGTWCEATDSDRHFTVSYLHKLMESRPFAAAAMALTSQHLDARHHTQRQRQSTLSLYQHAVQLLLQYEPTQCGEATLATCILLSIYEMMASDVDEWRRHLKGCVLNLKTKGWNGSSPGFVNACFWAFARIDVCAAFTLDEKTLIPTGDWVDDSNVQSVAATATIDAYCNLATLVFAKIVNLIATSREQQAQLAGIPSEVNALWRELQDWQSHRPRKVLPLIRSEPHHGTPFPTVLYTSSSSICGNTFYHGASILLLQTGYVYRDETYAEEDRYDPVWHARELCGISTANASHANWVNQVQLLCIAGQVFGDTSTRQPGASPQLEESDMANDEEYAAEKLALLKHLARIERETGWPTSGRRADLRRHWGLE